ncbi:MAG: SCO family protein [Solirubrobacterales bacterium]|nr:SCO family protein [Solirubrobacterales bacterium]
MIGRAGPWPLLACLAALLGGCGSGAVATGDSANGVAGSGFQGLVIRPEKPEPPLALRDYTGGRVNLRAFRGKAVLVTFVYTHCPDVCPLIVSNLTAAQRQLGARARAGYRSWRLPSTRRTTRPPRCGSSSPNAAPPGGWTT